MDNLFVLFLKTLSAAVKSDPKKLWRQIKTHFASRTWYYGTKNKKSYYFNAGGNNFVPLSRDDLAEEMRVRGLFYAPKIPLKKVTLKHQPRGSKGKENEAIKYKLAEFLSAVRETRRVSWVGELAGHSPGPVTLNGVPCLITHGPKLLIPCKGDHSPVYKIVESLLGCAPEQLDYFWAVFQRAVRFCYEGRYEPMQILFFAGNPDDGKTLLATEILSACLGGRRTDATSYFIGGTHFNADLARCELWIVDDMGDAKGFDRLVYNNNLKKVSADPDLRVEAKGVDAINVSHLFHLVVVLFNLEGRGGSHLAPTLTEDNKGKYQLFRTQRADLPTGPKQYQELQKRIRDALPATLYWLLHEYVANPKVLSGDRFQVHPYHNPHVRNRIQETGAASQILPIIEQWMKEAGKEEWYGSAGVLYQDLLNGSPGMAKVVGSMFKSSISLGIALGELSRRYPERIFKNEIDDRGFYRILSPAKAKAVAEATDSVSVTPPTANVVKAKFQKHGTDGG
jgi:hypothetical protein